MISVQEAQRIILKEQKDFGGEFISLKDAYGRVLREDIVADRDQPPIDKALMDGIAIAFDVWKKGARTFVIEGTVPAGAPPVKVKRKDSCVKIMTGAPLPKGFDCVIPVERISVQGKSASISESLFLTRGQNIRFKGSDHAKGKVLLKKGVNISAPQLGIIASVGKDKVKVSRLPKIAVIATGDELVAIKKSVKPYQTRLSNSFCLAMLFNSAKIAEAVMFHLPDDKKILARDIKKILKDFDILVLSGGVSMGEFDYVPEVLADLGVRKLFHKVAQKPGKPLWFGKSPSGKIIFALPGNPVSTLVCAYRYVVPFLKKSLIGSNVMLASSGRIQNPKDLTIFLPVQLKGSQAVAMAGGGSGDFGSLGVTDGFIELAPSKIITKDVPFYPWRIDS